MSLLGKLDFLPQFHRLGKNSKKPHYLRSRSAVGWLYEASIVDKVRVRPQIAGYLEGEILVGRYPVHSVYYEADRELACAGVSMMYLGAIRARAVAEVPVISDRGHTASFGLRREIDHLAGICCCGRLRRHGWGSLGNALVDQLDHPHRLGWLVLQPHCATLERNRLILVQHIRRRKHVAGRQTEVRQSQRVRARCVRPIEDRQYGLPLIFPDEESTGLSILRLVGHQV